MSDLFQHSKRIQAKLKLISKENVKHPINVLFTLRIMVHHFLMGSYFPFYTKSIVQDFVEPRISAGVEWLFFSKSVQADNRIKAARVLSVKRKPRENLRNCCSTYFKRWRHPEQHILKTLETISDSWQPSNQRPAFNWLVFFPSLFPRIITDARQFCIFPRFFLDFCYNGKEKQKAINWGVRKACGL